MKTVQLSALLAAAILLVLAAPQPASASPLDPAHVPGDAKWVIHLDLSALTETELAEQVREKRPRMVEGVRQWMQQRYGINPREDLDSVTMFSESYESHTGTMILKSNYDREKVESELEGKEGVETDSWTGHTLYTIDKAKMKAGEERRSDDRSEAARGQADEGDAAARPGAADRDDTARQGGGDWTGRTTVLVLYDDQTVIFASSVERAKAAVDLMKGNYPSLKGKNSPLLAQLPDGAILYGAAIDLQSIEQHEGLFPVLSQHERIVWAIGQQGDEIYENLTLVAKSPDVAEQMKETIEGFVALSKVWAADNETLRGLIDGTELSLEDRTVEVKWRGETGDVVEALTVLRERFQKRFGRMHEHEADRSSEEK